MEITIKIEAEGLEGAIHTLAQVLANYDMPVKDRECEGKVEAPKQETKKNDAPKAETKKEDLKVEKSEDKPSVSLETVRAKLAALSQAGKQKDVKALITGFDAKKLTDISEADYPALLAKAEEL